MGENTNRSEPFFDEDVDLVKLQFTDIFGQCKMVQMTRGQAEMMNRRAPLRCGVQD